MIFEVLFWILIILICFCLKRRRIYLVGKHLPGPKGYPLIGNSLMFFGKPERAFVRLQEISKLYNKIVALWFGPKLHVLIFNANDAEIILKNSRNTVKSEEYQFLKPWLGDSILISEGLKFKTHKKLLTPSFHVQNLRQYLQVFNVSAKVLVDKLAGHLDQEEFDLHPYLSLTTMSILLETSMGVKKETLGREAIDYANAVEKLGRCAHRRVYSIFHRFSLTFKYSKLKKSQDKHLAVVHPLTERVIAERKKLHQRNLEIINGEEELRNGKAGEWPIFIDGFLTAKDENGRGLSDGEIKDEVMTMMFAGQDTTTVSVGFALCLLGLHQEIQDKLLLEIDNIFPNGKAEITYEDCKNLQYMEQVIQETWRLFPPIPLIGKSPTVDIQLENHVIPKGCTVAIIIMLVHRDPKQFPNPDDFNPENFHPDRVKARNPYSFIPFSAGYRTCIGQRYAMLLIKVLLSYILKNYKVFSTIPTERYKLAAQTTLKRMDGFKISLARRKFKSI